MPLGSTKKEREMERYRRDRLIREKLDAQFTRESSAKLQTERE